MRSIQDSGVSASLHDDIRKALDDVLWWEKNEADDESAHMEEDPSLVGDDSCADSDDDKPLASLVPSVVVKPHAGEANEPEPNYQVGVPSGEVAAPISEVVANPVEDIAMPSIEEIEEVLDAEADVKRRKKEIWGKYKGSATCHVCKQTVSRDTLKRHQKSAKCVPPGGGAIAGA